MNYRNNRTYSKDNICIYQTFFSLDDHNANERGISRWDLSKIAKLKAERNSMYQKASQHSKTLYNIVKAER